MLQILEGDNQKFFFLFKVQRSVKILIITMLVIMSLVKYRHIYTTVVSGCDSTCSKGRLRLSIAIIDSQVVIVMLNHEGDNGVFHTMYQSCIRQWCLPYYVMNLSVSRYLLFWMYFYVSSIFFLRNLYQRLSDHSVAFSWIFKHQRCIYFVQYCSIICNAIRNHSCT